MVTKHLFLRWQSGIASVAEVAVELQPSNSWAVTWDADSSLVRGRSFFGDAVEEGIQIAAREFERGGGKPHYVKVVELVDWPADTRKDAVRCAAALATWKALGGSESDASVVFEQGEWKITFGPSSEHASAEG